MEALFVCAGNVGRSPAAEYLYNQQRPGQAASAGTVVDRPGERLKERFGSAPILLAMAEIGLDMSNNLRTALSAGMLANFAHVVVMAEAETWPPYLLDYANTEIWLVEDHLGRTIHEARLIRDQISELVHDLIKRVEAEEKPLGV